MVGMPLRAFTALLLLLPVLAVTAAETRIEFKAEPHKYLERVPNDRFALVQKQWAEGKSAPNTESDKAFLTSVLKALDIPISSQLLVFSASSMQSEIINPRNPRALYYNEDTYVGYVPGGRLEIIGMDPEMGPMFYLFDRLAPGGRMPAITRSERCFNCHAGNATGRVPGLIIESLLPMASGASLETYRRDEQGHQVPLAKRFGGWHLTGEHRLKETLANLMGRTTGPGATFEKTRIEPGQMSNLDLHLRPTSDILSHLVHEHQIGFENRVFQAGYAMRQWLFEGKGRVPMASQEAFEKRADELARYILFADEAKLPPEGIVGDPDFISEFQRNKKALSNGASLKDFDLRTHIFKYRCSYMLYTESWLRLPKEFKDRVYYKMAEGLRDANANPAYAHLPANEKRAIRVILKETLPGLPAWWR
jgi:hypothetical protein